MKMSVDSLPVNADATVTALSSKASGSMPPLKLNIVFMSVGTRGDMQPHLAIAKELQQGYGHRVRFVGSEKYRDTVEANGVEFYSWGSADPREAQRRRLLPRKELMEIVPTIRREFFEMGLRYWGACLGDPVGVPSDVSPDPFLADAIISVMTPFEHSWVSSRMGIPLHMLGTNPRSPSRYLPHSQSASAYTGESVSGNVFSWWFEEFKFYQSFKNEFTRLRLQVLGLESFSPLWWVSQWNRLRVPFTNIFSPNLVSAPPDWEDHIDIASFVFHSEPNYEPPADLIAFLETGLCKPTIYAGFGSMPIPDPIATFEEILKAAAQVGVRVVLSSGLSGLDSQALLDKHIFPEEDLFLVDSCPHDWLFPRVTAVVIHGGAGTTAMALKCARPTIVCPVAGDQPFWGHRVWKTGCGPEPLYFREITADAMAARIQESMQPEIAAAAADMAAKLNTEAPGEKLFAQRAQGTFSIYDREGRCDVLPSKVAAWRIAGSQRKLSAVAAHFLVEQGKVSQGQLTPLMLAKTPDLAGPGDPLSGFTLGVSQVISNVAHDVKMIDRRADPEVAEDYPIGTSTAGVTGGGAILLGLVFIVLHILRAPLTLLHHVLFGLYNLIDFIAYELGSRTRPDLFASNPRLYSFPQMIGFLLSKPFKEMASITNCGGHPTWAALAPIRFLIALLNILFGLLALTTRAIEIQLGRLMGERTKRDSVLEAKIRFGKLEAEHMIVSEGEAKPSVAVRIIQAWDELQGAA